MKKKKSDERVYKIISALLALAVLVTIVAGIISLGEDSGKNGLEQLEKSLRRAAVACYASEGVYPPNVEYMKEHYGLQIDDSRYIVHYMVFAENLMPEITVLERTE